MNDQADNQQQPVSKRGEAAWKEAKERVAARNEEARKDGRQRREAKDRQRVQALRSAERREMEEAIASHRP